MSKARTHAIYREPNDDPGISQGKIVLRSPIMSSAVFHSSRPNEWVLPRPHLDAHQRRLTYGPIRPMEQPGLLERLFFGAR